MVSFNCLSCILKDAFRFCCVAGTPCINVRCIHTRSFRKCEFSISKFGFCTSYLLCGFLILNCSYSIHTILNAENKVTELINNIATLVYTAESITLVISYSFLTGELIKVLKQFMDLIDLWYQIEILFDEKNITVIRNRIFNCLLFVIISTFTFVVYITSQRGKLNPSFLELITTLIAFYINIAGAISYIVIISIFALMLSNYQDGVKLRLEKHIANGPKPKLLLNGNILYILKFSKIYHHRIIKCYQNFTKLFGGVLFAHMLNTVLILITSGVTSIIYIWGNSRNSQFVSFQFEFCTSSVIVLYCHTLTHKLNFVNDDFLSYLFKYPISQLCASEANLVELFIKTLVVQKPEFIVKDVFQVGMKLLARILGLVITYILVCLQFYFMWIFE